MRAKRPVFILMALAAVATVAAAQTGGAAEATYVGAETCLECHDTVGAKMGAHGKPAFANLTDHGCETCHGPSSIHADDPDVVENRPTMAGKSAAEKSAICQSCHDGRAQFFWSGSTHETRNVACTDCHSVHSPKSEKAQLVESTRLELCFSCHKNVRADLWKNSHHPIREGKISCSDCHNPQGTQTAKMVLGESVNELCYPEICKETDISFEALGHPLIAEEKRVCNTINFSNGRFIILTGSNMAGKSTFLRTLGINMILAGIGSPVCGSKARVHPLPVMVSMRLSDSLRDNESYFFKEVKRLKEIMDRASMEICFVILDEILRGTNSDDKRNGTIGVIRKIIDKTAIGAIATHDLEICKTAEEFPDILCNKCFEVEIINDDLFFDYKLKDGICRNKSATFLMKKMER